MKYLKQRQVLGYVKNDEGQPVYIDRHFGDDIEALMSKLLLAASLTTTTTTATTNGGPSQASFDTLTALVTAMQLDLATLILRVAALEKGYQS